MSRDFEIQEGMQVYGGDQLLGRVERLHGDGFHVNGLHYTREMVTRVEHNRIYIGVAAAMVGDEAAASSAAAGATTRPAPAETQGGFQVGGESAATGSRAGLRSGGESVTTGATTTGRDYGAVEEDEIRVPIVEERLAVGKREVEVGEVEIRKTVETEEQTVPITLTREEVIVNEVRVEERPATGDDLFKETTIRVRLRGEEAVVAKETIVTGEVVIEKEATAEERQITDTVRRLRVEVEENYQRDRAALERDFAARQATTGGTRTFADAEQHYRAGYAAAHDERYAGQEFEQAEPAMRREYEASGIGAGGGQHWQELRDSIRAGWERARGR